MASANAHAGVVPPGLAPATVSVEHTVGRALIYFSCVVSFRFSFSHVSDAIADYAAFPPVSEPADLVPATGDHVLISTEAEMEFVR